MRKILGAIALLLMTSCSGNGSSEKEQENYSQATDSIVETVVEDENLGTAENQGALEDSIMNAQIEEEYKKGLSLKKTNAKLRQTTYGEPPWPYYTFDFIVENNSSIEWSGSDYYISYSILNEDFNEKDGGLYDKWFSKKVKGKDVTAGKTVSLSHKSDGWKYKGVKLNKNLSKEEFAKRFKEQTVFDKTQNKFIPKNQ